MKKNANAYDLAFRAKASTWALNQVSLLDQEATISFFFLKLSNQISLELHGHTFTFLAARVLFAYCLLMMSLNLLLFLAGLHIDHVLFVAPCTCALLLYEPGIVSLPLYPLFIPVFFCTTAFCVCLQKGYYKMHAVSVCQSCCWPEHCCLTSTIC